MTEQVTIDAQNVEEVVLDDDLAPDAGEMADLLMSILSDGLDHPEVWSQIRQMLQYLPTLPQEVAARLAQEHNQTAQGSAILLLAICYGVQGHVDFALEQLEPLAAMNSQSALVQGAIFYLLGLKDPENPKFHLHGKICRAPFKKLDVLETTAHLCCASWLQASAGDLSRETWDGVWNSDTAQDIRASIHDGSYRFCNKMACPVIQGADLVPEATLADESDFWRDVLAERRTAMLVGPESVNLAYDRTCNLSCPSCRVEKYAADEKTRAAYDEMQQKKILPLLRNAKLVFITGSGDPFASKNFRHLMTELTPEAYPELRIQVMTNGMLFTPRQWDAFPNLHGRTQILKISIDAATGPTHELLRRGARWPVMLENMTFAGTLAAQGLVDYYELVFTVQTENYREMGDAVDLAKAVGASGVYFGRMTNWGTFTAAEYAEKAVFLPSHPEHAAFLECMADPRLRDPIVILGDLNQFLSEPPAQARKFRVDGKPQSVGQ